MNNSFPSLLEDKPEEAERLVADRVAADAALSGFLQQSNGVSALVGRSSKP